MSRILDLDGNPFETASLAAPQTAHTAWLEREFENHPARGLTPSRLHSILTSAEQRDIAGQIDLADDIEERDGHCFAELSKRKLAVAALEWDIVEPKGATAAEEAQTAQLREWFKSIPDFEGVILDLMDGVLKGFSANELVWTMRERVLLPSIRFRPQRWFTIAGQRDELLLRSQTMHEPARDGLPPVMGEPLRPYSWMVHRPRSRTGYLARAGLVRVLAWPFIFKNYAVRDLAEFLEIFGLPLRVGSYPAGASEKEKRTLLRAVTDIGHNAAGIIPQGMKIDFQNAAQGTHVPFTSMVEIMDAVQSKVILGQTLSSSEGKNGTQALGTVHNDVRLEIRRADVRAIENTLNKQLLLPMALINIANFNPARAPRFQLDDGETEDITAYADALPKLAKAGMRIKTDWAHERLGIPIAEDGDEVLVGDAPVEQPPAGEQPGAPGSRTPPGAAPPAPKAVANGAKAAPLAGTIDADPPPARDALDDVVDDMLGDWQELMGPMVEPLLAELDKAVAQGATLAEFRERMPKLLDSMNYRPMASTLARGTFIARLAGEADLELEIEQATTVTGAE